jgi:hypothetical protein
MYFNVYSIPVFIAGLIMLILVVMTYKYRASPGVKYFSLLMLAGGVYLLKNTKGKFGWKVSREKALNFILHFLQTKNCIY